MRAPIDRARTRLGTEDAGYGRARHPDDAAAAARFRRLVSARVSLIGNEALPLVLIGQWLEVPEGTVPTQGGSSSSSTRA